MPVYEFLCPHCNRVYSFLSRDARKARKKPTCPKCRRRDMRRLFSRFSAISRSPARRGHAEAPPGGDGTEPDLSPEQEARLERTLSRLARDIDKIDENNPRQLGRLMRQITEAIGEPLDAQTDEMVRRLEGGEDPEKVEEKLGEPLEPQGARGEGGPDYDEGLYDL